MISWKKQQISIGFLKQDIDFVKGRTVLEEAYEAFKLIKQLENHGYTHQEALSKIQSLYENMKKNQAMRDSAMIIGDSISNNNNNSYRQPFY